MEELKESECYVLGLENKKEFDEKYFAKMFESYGHSTNSLKIVERDQFITLKVEFKQQLPNKKSLDLPGFGVFEITKSNARINQFNKKEEEKLEEEREIESFPFLRYKKDFFLIFFDQQIFFFCHFAQITQIFENDHHHQIAKCLWDLLQQQRIV